MLVFVQIVAIDSPARVLVGHQRVQTLFLLLLADMEEEFHHQIAVVGERALSCVDAANILLVIVLTHIVFHPPRYHLVHPVGVKKRKLAGFRDLQQISVQEGIAKLLLGGSFHRLDPEETGVNALDHAPDDAALAGCTPSFKNDHNRKLGLFDLRLKTGQFGLRFLEFFPQLFLFRLYRLDKILQHFMTSC